MIRHVRLIASAFVVALGCAMVGGAGGCAGYVTPGPGADMRAFGAAAAPAAGEGADTPYSIRQALERRPAARFPTGVAVARVQSPSYSTFTAQSYGSGAYSVVTTRDVETEQDMRRLSGLPMLRAVAPLNRLLLPERLESDLELRNAAAALHADILLIYTIDTDFYVRDMATPLTVVSLGLSPNREARVVTTASAIVMDTRTGYIYGTAEATERDEQLTAAWTDQNAVDAARLRTERAAFENLLANLEQTWHGVVTTYAGTTTQPSAAAH